MQSSINSNEKQGYLTISVGDSEIICVPSFHSRLEFSYVVHTMARKKIEAVAVELAADFAQSAECLIKEHLGPDGVLPGALALFRSCDSHCEYLPVSESDSIITAIKLGITENIPIYGVDLDVFGGLRRVDEGDFFVRGILPDPSGIKTIKDLEEYVVGLCECSEMTDRSQLDTNFDSRNNHMARRLRQLTTVHKRILFVCGMAHFAEVRRMLTEVSIQPLSEKDSPALGLPISPVVLSPTIAHKYYNPFPRVVNCWRKAGYRPVGTDGVFEAALSEAVNKCADEVTRKRACFGAITPRELTGLRTYLDNLMTVQGVFTPSIAIASQAAASTVPRLTAPLLESMMRFPWLQKGELHYPYLTHASEGDDNDGVWVRLDGQEFRTRQIRKGEGMDFSCTELSEEDSRKEVLSARYRTFPVDDRIATMVAVRVAGLKNKQKEEDGKEFYQFEDTYSLMSGIDTRRTFRAMAAGRKNSLTVFERKRFLHEPEPDSTKWPYPLVFVFSTTRSPGSSLFSWYAPVRSGSSLWSRNNCHALVGFGTTTHGAQYTQKTLDVVVHFLPLVYSDTMYDQDPKLSSWDRFLRMKGNGKRVPCGPTDISLIAPALVKSSDPAHDIVSFALEYADSCSVITTTPELRCSLNELVESRQKNISIYDAGVFPSNLIQRVRMPLLVEYDYADTTFWRGGRAAPGVTQSVGESEDLYAGIDFSLFAVENLEKHKHK